MTRVVVACVLACIPFAARADDPKPDVAKLKDEVELLEAKLGVHKAKVAGAVRTAHELKGLVDRLAEAERKGASALAERLTLGLNYTKAETDVEVFKAEQKVAEVKLTQAKRRLAAAEKVGAAPVRPEKAYAVRFENKPWADVFEWFAQESGLVNASTAKPTGAVTIKPRDGKLFTMAEIVDLLNEMLAPNWVLVRGKQTFAILPADEKIDGSSFPLVAADDLGKFGKTELVSVLIPLGALDPDDTVQVLKFLLSSFGSVRPIGKTAIIVSDKAGNVRRIVDAVKH
jgi:hypothetical protein